MPIYKLNDVFNVGKYKNMGRTCADVLKSDPGYVAAHGLKPNVVYGQQLRRAIAEIKDYAGEQSELF